MSGWRVAKSLLHLRSQVDSLFPSRNKENDGTIGDAAHAARTSDHNPWVDDGVVTALDITHDPSHGFDSYKFAEELRQSRDPRIKYVISNHRIFSSQVGAWTWRPYNGSNPHDHHVHISVLPYKSKYDSVEDWKVPMLNHPLPTHSEAPVANFFEHITATEFGGSNDPNTSAYDGHRISDTELGVALPYHFSGTRPKVRVHGPKGSAVADIVDIGPWNTNDPYWKENKRPQAETGIDHTGRHTNRAGIDLTPALARRIGINGMGLVNWEFMTPDTKVPTKTAVAPVSVAVGGVVGAGAVATTLPIVQHYNYWPLTIFFSILGVVGLGVYLLRKKFNVDDNQTKAQQPLA